MWDKQFQRWKIWDKQFQRWEMWNRILNQSKNCLPINCSFSRCCWTEIIYLFIFNIIFMFVFSFCSNVAVFFCSCCCLRSGPPHILIDQGLCVFFLFVHLYIKSFCFFVFSVPFYRLRSAPYSSHWPSSFSALHSIQASETRSSRFPHQPGKYKIIQGYHCLILRISRIDVILNLLWFRHQFSFRYFFRRSTFNSHKRELCWSRVDSFLGLLGKLKMWVQRAKLHKQWSEPWNELQNDFFQNTS